MSGRKIFEHNPGLELFILPGNEGDSRVDQPDQHGIQKDGKQYAVRHDHPVAQRGPYFAEIQNPDVSPVQDQSSFDVFFFRRTRIIATTASAAAPAIMRMIELLSSAASGAA